MVDLNLLENLVKNAKLKSPSEKHAEEHFDQIVSYIEQEKIKEAAGLIENVFSKDVPDIRLIVYYLYAHFADHGIKSFAKTFPFIQMLVSNEMEILTPKNRIDKHIQSSLNWFFSHLLQKFKYYEKLQKSDKNSTLWKENVLGNASNDLNQITAIVQEFNLFFLEKWPQSPTKDKVLHLVKKIEEIQKMVESEKSIEVHEEIEEQEEPMNSVANIEPTIPTMFTEVLEDQPKIELIDEEDLNGHDFTKETPEEALVSLEIKTPDEIEAPGEIEEQSKIQDPIPLSCSLPSKEKGELADSLHLFIESLNELSYKLKIFETLIQENDYLKASVVASDIDHLIEHFDPLSYFPKLFAKYFSLFAKHVTALTEQYEKKESLQVKALKKLYRTDLELFMDW